MFMIDYELCWLLMIVVDCIDGLLDWLLVVGELVEVQCRVEVKVVFNQLKIMGGSEQNDTIDEPQVVDIMMQ